jgi:hypothetical protein
VNYRQVQDITQRRKVRLLVAGTVGGTVSGAPAVAALWLNAAGGPTSLLDPPMEYQFAYTAFLVMPISFWWAIVRHQLEDVGAVDGGALQLLHDWKPARCRHWHGRARPAIQEQALGTLRTTIEGETLAHLLRENGRFGGEEAAAIGRTLCGALAAVHLAGLVHQDVKTQNVMRERGEHGGRYVLMDFGAGVRSSDAARPRWGTPVYMAPELFEGAPASIVSDIYSLGVLMNSSLAIASGCTTVRLPPRTPARKHDRLSPWEAESAGGL